MNRQREDNAHNVRISSQTSGEDEICSNKATRGSSDLGADDLGLVPTRSRSSERGTQRPISGPLPQDQQASQASDPDTARTAPITLSLGGSSFMGLTLPPLPSAMLPMKKRPLDEVLSDETPPQQDKMSAEIDQLAEEAPLQPDNLSVGPSETHNVAPHRQKRSKNNEEPSTSQALPIVARNSATDSDGSERRPPERRPERVSEASRRGSRANPS